MATSVDNIKDLLVANLKTKLSDTGCEQYAVWWSVYANNKLRNVAIYYVLPNFTYRPLVEFNIVYYEMLDGVGLTRALDPPFMRRWVMDQRHCYKFATTTNAYVLEAWASIREMLCIVNRLLSMCIE